MTPSTIGSTSPGYLERLAVRLDIVDILTPTLDRHARQIVQELARSVLDITGGQLRDDAPSSGWSGMGPPIRAKPPRTPATTAQPRCPDNHTAARRSPSAAHLLTSAPASPMVEWR